MDKEAEQIMEEIEESLARDSKREHWALIPVAQASHLHPACTVIDSESG